MNPTLLQFGRDLWADLRDPDVFWQLGALALCLGIAWWLARVLRRHLGGRLSERLDERVADGGERARTFGQHVRLVGGGFSRILFPLLAAMLFIIGGSLLVRYTMR